jgi:predicted transcriptional regulator
MTHKTSRSCITAIALISLAYADMLAMDSAYQGKRQRRRQEQAAQRELAVRSTDGQPAAPAAIALAAATPLAHTSYAAAAGAPEKASPRESAAAPKPEHTLAQATKEPTAALPTAPLAAAASEKAPAPASQKPADATPGSAAAAAAPEHKLDAGAPAKKHDPDTSAEKQPALAAQTAATLAVLAAAKPAETTDIKKITEATPGSAAATPVAAPTDDPGAILVNGAEDSHELTAAEIQAKLPVQVSAADLIKEKTWWFGTRSYQRGTLMKYVSLHIAQSDPETGLPTTELAAGYNDPETRLLINTALASFVKNGSAEDRKSLITVLHHFRKTGIPIDAYYRRLVRGFLNKERAALEKQADEKLTRKEGEAQKDLDAKAQALAQAQQKHKETLQAMALADYTELEDLRTALLETTQVRDESGNLSDDEAPARDNYSSPQRFLEEQLQKKHLVVEKPETVHTLQTLAAAPLLLLPASKPGQQS